MSCAVQYGRHSHSLFRFIDFVNHAVGKVVRIAPTNIPRGMMARVQKGIRYQGIPHFDQLLRELRPQSGLSGFVLLGRFSDVLLNFRRELDAPAHLG
jgi:hypothetical protein